MFFLEIKLPSKIFGKRRNVTSSLTNKDPQTLHIALFNLCYVFHIVFIKHINCCIVSHTIVQRNIHQIPMIIPAQNNNNSPKIKTTKTG